MANDQGPKRSQVAILSPDGLLRFGRRFDALATPIAVSLVAGLVRLAIGCYELSLPYVLGGALGRGESYDEGSYLGTATRFVHGVLPYKDFAFPAPPGITYLMTPVALVGRVGGTSVSLEIARCITVVVVALNVVLAGLIVRRVGRFASALTAFSFALWPLTVSVDPTMELEPYLVFFCLLGALLIFDGDRLGSWRRVLLGGIALGFSVLVKTWGILVVASMLLVCLPQWRRRGFPLVLGIAGGMVVLCIPFLIVAPHAFVQNAIFSQLERKPPYTGITPLGDRFMMMTGLVGLVSVAPSSAVAEDAFAIFGLMVLGVFGFGFRHRILVEWFTLFAAAIVFVGMFKSADFYNHYGYFPAPFFAMLLGVCGSRIASAMVHATKRIRLARRLRFAAAITLFVGAVGVVLIMIGQDVAYAQNWLSASYDPAAKLDSTIPPGSCVIDDYPTELLEANRYTPARDNCPAGVDPFGTWLIEDDGNPPHPNGPYPPAFEQEWLDDLEAADYVVIALPFTDAFPWMSTSEGWFTRNYRVVASYSFADPLDSIDSTDLLSGTAPLTNTLYVYQNVSGLQS